MPAGKATKNKEADPVQELDEAPEELAEPDQFEDEEFPAVGESVTYVDWDDQRSKYFEYAALITQVNPPHRSVQLVVFAPHSRQGRSMQAVSYRPQNLDDIPASHWRYPEAPPVPPTED